MSTSQAPIVPSSSGCMKFECSYRFEEILSNDEICPYCKHHKGEHLRAEKQDYSIVSQFTVMFTELKKDLTTDLQGLTTDLQGLTTDLKEDVGRFAPLVARVTMSTFNPSQESSISLERCPRFRLDAINASYPGQGDVRMPLPDGSVRLVKTADRNVACMLTGALGNQHQVVAAHIMPHSATDDMLQFAGISRAEVGSTRNCLLLAYNVEKAFDRLDISFVPVSVLQPFTYKLVIWTPRGLRSGEARRRHPGDIRLEPIWQDSTICIGQFEGSQLFCGRNSVLKRALSNQAFQAFLRARKRGWVSEFDEAPFDFGSSIFLKPLVYLQLLADYNM